MFGASFSFPSRTKHRTRSSNSPIQPRQIERLIENSGLQWTFLRPGMFAATFCAGGLRRFVPAMSCAGPIFRPTAPIDERDIARVAVQALCDDGPAGADYVLTGPDSLTGFEQISIIGRVIGRTLRIEEISPDEARQNFAPDLRRPRFTEH